MPSLSDRLKSLGVKVGTQNLPAAPPRILRISHPIESVLPGDWFHTSAGDVFFVETIYKSDFKVGRFPIYLPRLPKIIAAWANAPELADLDPSKFVFLDTETTGLVGGTGIYTFLIGAARFEGEFLRLNQFFLHDPAGETAQLAAFEDFLAPCEAVVSFNGKSFDIPLLKTRYTLNGWPSPFSTTAHLDLLHLARRLWKTRLPSCTLGDLEAYILRTKRSEQDVPGWMIADLYFDYLHTGDARPLRSVFYHNEIDVLSLAALLSHIVHLVSYPLSDLIEHNPDLFAIGKLFQDFGFWDIAQEILQNLLGSGKPDHNEYWDALKLLSFNHKKQGDIASAMILWEKAARSGHIYAHEELAKIYEHAERDYLNALDWTNRAIDIASSSAESYIERLQWVEILEYRKNRLLRKIGQTSGDENGN